MSENVELKKEEMQLSDKVTAIKRLPDSDNKDTVVQEIRALKNFSSDERSSIFGNQDILWIIENFTIRELKEKAEKSLVRLDVKVGDVVRYEHQTCLVLSVRGKSQDRLTLMYLVDGDFQITEGVSVYNVTIKSHLDIDSMLSTLMK